MGLRQRDIGDLTQRILQQLENIGCPFFARYELLPSAQAESKAPIFETLDIGNTAQIDEVRSIDAHEIARCQHRRELLVRRPRKKALVTNMDRHIVAANLEIIDVIRLEEVEAMRSLTDEQATIARSLRSGLSNVDVSHGHDGATRDSRVDRFIEFAPLDRLR